MTPEQIQELLASFTSDRARSYCELSLSRRTLAHKARERGDTRLALIHLESACVYLLKAVDIQRTHTSIGVGLRAFAIMAKEGA